LVGISKSYARGLPPSDDDNAAWRQALRLGTQALLAGRFDECERRADEVATAGAAGDSAADRCGSLLLSALRREQGRPAEAEVLLRSLRRHRPDDLIIPAASAAVLVDLGRDTEARSNLELLTTDGAPALAEGVPNWLPAGVLLAEACAVLESPPAAEVLAARLGPHAGTMAVEADGAVCYGSVSRALGLLAHTTGDLDAASAHFEQALGDHLAVGARPLWGHTCRHYSATLRARAAPGDWERARELLASAVDVYSDLGIESLAAQSEAVLQRSMDDV